MDIEVVGDKVPAGCGHRAFYHFPDMGYEVIFIACIAASNGVNLSVGYRKAHDKSSIIYKTLSLGLSQPRCTRLKDRSLCQ